MDEDKARQRLLLYSFARLGGLAVFFLGIAIIYTDLVRPGGWPQVGAVVAIIGVIDSLFVPRLVKKAWDQRDAAAAERARHGRTDASNE